MLLPDWSVKGSRPAGSFGQYTQSNMFTNPTYEQQGKPQALANMLRQPQMQQPMQPNMQQQMYQNPMQPQPYQAGIQQQSNMMGSAPNQMMNNWNSQYGSN